MGEINAIREAVIPLVAHFGSVKTSLDLAAALHQAVPSLPIVLETKSVEEIGADGLVNAGIADVVRWPMAAAEIAAALNRCLSLRKREAKTASSTSRDTNSMAQSTGMGWCQVSKGPRQAARAGV